MLLVDAGPLYAAADRRDHNHDRCAALFREHVGTPFVVPALVLTEVAHLLGDRIGPDAETAFAGSLAAGELLVEPPTPADWTRIVELCAAYRDLPLGIADASVVAAAERLEMERIVTLDHRHFATVRPTHVGAFTLLPT